MKTKRKKLTINGQIQNYKLAHITWNDILSDNSWLSTERAAKLKPATCHSVGYILSKTNETLIFSLSGGAPRQISPISFLHH